MSWECKRERDAFSTVHVVPINDLIDHVPDCICGPKTEPVPGKDGSFGWLTTHHSLDGREAHEGGTPISPPEKGS